MGSVTTILTTVSSIMLVSLCLEATDDFTTENELLMLSTPSNLKVIEGDTVLLPCKVKNLKRNVRVWKHLPSNILFSGNIVVSRDSKVSLVDDSLQIEKITPAYAGEYVCQISKHVGVNVKHTISVNVPASVSPDPPEGKVVLRKGDSATIYCNPSGIPRPHVTWTYGDEYVQGSALPRGVRQVKGSQLQISSVDIHHAGIYQCHAENDVGEPAVATFDVNVHYAPELLIKPEWAHGDAGATIEFVCICRSSPSSHVAWHQGDHKRKEKLESDGRIRLRLKQAKENVLEYTLRIQRLRKEDLGQYTCTAKNSVGQSWKTVEISGLAEPIHLRGNQTGEGSFLLKWRAKSFSPIIEYQLKIRKYRSGDQWTDVVIPAATQEGQSFIYSQTYEVTGLETGARYEVVLQAHNDFGWNRPSETFFFGEEIPTTETMTEEVETVPSLLPLYDAELDITDPPYLHQTSATDGLRTIFSSLALIITVFLAPIQFFLQ